MQSFGVFIRESVAPSEDYGRPVENRGDGAQCGYEIGAAQPRACFCLGELRPRIVRCVLTRSHQRTGRSVILTGSVTSEKIADMAIIATPIQHSSAFCGGHKHQSRMMTHVAAVETSDIGEAEAGVSGITLRACWRAALMGGDGGTLVEE